MTETYTVDSGDKLTEVSVSGVPVKTFGYDGAGRTTSIQTSAGTTSFTYDFESRVTGITYPNSSTNSFTYNGLDTRVGKTDSAGTATFHRMGAGVTAPVLGDGSASFTPGISERRGSTSSFYGADYLGTNSALYSASETVSATRQYDAFGNLTSSSGSSANPFGFAGNWGYQNDADSGLKLLGHRYYDASTGRFLTRDPIKDGRNWYAYCGNDPVGAVDPEGLFFWCVVGALAFTAYGLYTFADTAGDLVRRGRRNAHNMDEAFAAHDLEQCEDGRERVRVLVRETAVVIGNEIQSQYVLGPVLSIPSRSMKPTYILDQLGDPAGSYDTILNIFRRPERTVYVIAQ